MFVVGICAGPGGKVDRIAVPALMAQHPDAVVIVRTGQRSIWAAYESIRREAMGADAEGLILMHDDVELRGDIFTGIRKCLTDPTVGLVGAVGGRGQTFEWWGTPDRYGYAEDLDGKADHVRGTHDVDGIDGLLMALPASVLPEVNFAGHGYPAWHGYDAYLSALVRSAGYRVQVTDLPLFHHSQTSVNTNWTAFEQARYAHYLRWRDAGVIQRLAWRRYRLQLRVKSRLGIPFYKTDGSASGHR